MGYTDEQLNYVYDGNNGHCGKKLAWKNYGKRDFAAHVTTLSHMVPYVADLFIVL